ncbi:MAG: 16S rRNA (uracil(1498)-N(3))-methyltransferase [Candidatus Yanofskybacteria bacterium]|nr:16S rRNA (uracil(1498)-N(3))-methyltransferase [Candidatus Yanofskybacteria bacterium]
MKTHRFIGNFNIKPGDLRIGDPELFNQIKSVLKLKIGEKIILGDGRMNEGLAEIKELGRDFIGVEIGGINTNINEPSRHIILCCSILKRENFELVVQKATEAGVKEIIPIITERTVKLNIRPDRLEKIIKEAAEQSGRGIVPILRDPVNFVDATGGVNRNGINIIFDMSGEIFGNWKLEIGNYPLGVWIGPEGGWTDKELERARVENFKIFNLGKLTLRAETAAIIGTYLIVHNFSVAL